MGFVLSHLGVSPSYKSQIAGVLCKGVTSLGLLFGGEGCTSSSVCHSWEERGGAACRGCQRSRTFRSQQLVCRPPGKSVGGPLDQGAALPSSSVRASGPFPLYQAKEPTQVSALDCTTQKWQVSTGSISIFPTPVSPLFLSLPFPIGSDAFFS